MNFNCLQPLKKALHLTVTSISFESLRASFELGLADMKEELVEFGGVDEIVADQRGEEGQ